ncbi:sensor histidine kinase [Neoroseomonas lacus]|uniref:histidine kinase n=1 Tax=Neoroseomonas lacus TaxID=287609 RepID=A0A917L6Q2_9PROT|nr:histidine kinase dimerization/phosphoacceptor domain -containing protein [Neoroseomonas lacus]GGJ44775.1 sensor histidine kinase [Neoroseomonas lacus]
MATNDDKTGPLSELLGDANLAAALDSDHFKQFLDHIPVAIAVAELKPRECVIYANLEFERLSGQPVVELQGQPWSDLKAIATAKGDDRSLSDAITMGEDRIGRFRLGPAGVEGGITFEAWSNVIEDEVGAPLFRIVALAAVNSRSRADNEALETRVKERDVLLRELQHRVKNNLQMITSLIRMEGYNTSDDEAGESFDRLAGRVDALALLYRSLSEEKFGQSVDLGIYLSQIASAVMQAHAVEGIRLDLKVDSWPVSINVAMPTGLVVNEVLTNALKHAFVGRAGGTITLHSLVDSEGCQVSISDDGIGLPPGTSWPTSGRLGSLIVQSLRQNAGAAVEVISSPDRGLRVMIRFARAGAAPEVVES